CAYLLIILPMSNRVLLIPVCLSFPTRRSSDLAACLVQARAASPDQAVARAGSSPAHPAGHLPAALKSRAGIAGNPVVLIDSRNLVALIDHQSSGRLVAVAVAVAVAGTAQSTLCCGALLCGRVVEPVPAHRQLWPVQTVWLGPGCCRGCRNCRVFVGPQTPRRRLHSGRLDREHCLSSPEFRKALPLRRSVPPDRLAGRADPVSAKGLAIRKPRFAGAAGPRPETKSETHPVDTARGRRESTPVPASSLHPATGQSSGCGPVGYSPLPESLAVGRCPDPGCRG